jgi:antitoxin component YwqK of YwqJK toxin-antitoxin module
MKPLSGCVFEEYDNYKPKFEVNFKDGIPHGSFKEWYENGFVKYEYHFNKGRLHGNLELWNEEGRLIARENYVKGERVQSYLNYCEGKGAYGFGHLVSYYWSDDDYISGEEYDILHEWRDNNGCVISNRYRVIDDSYRTHVPHEPLLFGSEQLYPKIPMTPDPECDEYIVGIGEIEYPIDCELIASLQFKNGRFHGKQTYWKEKNEDDRPYSIDAEEPEVVFYKFCEENYLNGKKEGSQYKWDENEKLIEEENYKKGKKHGRQLYGYIDEGKLWEEENFLNGLKHGRQRYWKDEEILWKVENYSKGVLKGDQITYHFTNDHWGYRGEGRSIETYKNGILTKSIFEEEWGTQYVVNYKDGKLHGLAKGKDEESYYQFGERHGLTRGWYGNGQLRFEIAYIIGKPHGKCRTWYEDGRLNEEWNYREGTLDGPFKILYPSGQIHMEGVYDNNICVEITCRDKNGNPDESPKTLPKGLKPFLLRDFFQKI